MNSRTLVALGAVGICLATAGSASAASTTYCIDVLGCNGTPVASLQEALNDAQASPEPDRIEIGPGSYFPGPGSFTYAGSSTNTLTIVGAGADNTHLVATSGTSNVLALDWADVSDLEVQGAPPKTKKSTAAALALHHGTGSQLKLTGGVIGAWLQDGATLASSHVSRSGAVYEGAGVDATGAKTAVVDSTLDTAVNGVRVSGSASVVRSHITSQQTGVEIRDGGIARISDSLLEGPAAGPGAGVRFLGAGTTELKAVVTGSTLIYPAPEGLGVWMEALGSSKLTASVTGSAIYAGNYGLNRDPGMGSADLTVSNSAFDPAKVHDYAGAGFLHLGKGNIGSDPGFVDPAAHDYRLRPDSPLIDKGTATPQGGLGSGDVSGGPRSLDGDGDGMALPDIGAFEAPAVAPPVDPKPPVGPKPPLGQPDLAPVLSPVTLTHKRFKVRKRATTFRFKLSEAASVTIKIGNRKLVRTAHAGANRIFFGGKLGAAALKRGRYTARITARDVAGHASKTRKVSFRVV